MVKIPKQRALLIVHMRHIVKGQKFPYKMSLAPPGNEDMREGNTKYKQ